MRIVEISVEGLFGTFNHTIPLNQEDRITIIHSPNGFGKTAILRLIHSVFFLRNSELNVIPFKKFVIKFNNNTSLIFEKDDTNQIFWRTIEKEEVSERQIEWINSLNELVRPVKTLFISIQRVEHERTHQLRFDIEEKEKEYLELSQSLESTYPIRLVEKKNALELDELKNKLNNIEERQKELISAGLLDAKNLTSSSFIDKIDDSNKIALSLYAEDMSKKFSIFDEIEEKVDILKNIINSRFLYKEMLVGKGRGIYFVNDEGKELSFRELSSGEQHELVLFYQLLFETEEDTLVLIDEPEISLHVVWQNQFLKDLIRVAKNAKFDVLLATHSPQIIADRWDLTVELKGKQNSLNLNGNSKSKLTKAKV